MMRSYILLAGASALSMALLAAPNEGSGPGGKGARVKPAGDATDPRPVESAALAAGLAAAADVADSAAATSPSLGPDAVRPIDAVTASGAPSAIPVQDPGPGVGAQRIAVEAAGVHTVSFDALAVGRYLAEAERTGRVTPLERVRLARTITSAGAFAEARDLIDLVNPAVDPRDISGQRTLPALKLIRQDGKVYGPGKIEEISLDFEGYTELVNIGAVPPIDWATGEPLRV